MLRLANIMLSLDTCRCFLCELFQGVSSIPSPEQAEVSGPVLRTDGSVFPPFIWGQSTCVVCDDGDKGPGAINWAATSYRSTWLMSDSLNPAMMVASCKAANFLPFFNNTKIESWRRPMMTGPLGARCLLASSPSAVVLRSSWRIGRTQ